MAVLDRNPNLSVIFQRLVPHFFRIFISNYQKIRCSITQQKNFEKNETIKPIDTIIIENNKVAVRELIHINEELFPSKFS